jgi:hypothetical protein
MDGVVRHAIRGSWPLIILAVAAALWFYVFPWASLHLPIDSSGFTG